MASKDDDLDLDVSKGKGSMKKIILIVVAVVVLVGGGVGATLYFMGGHESTPATADGAATAEAPKPKGPPLYYAFDPPFVTSFQDQSLARFMQVTVEVMSHDEAAIKDVETYAPAIRNALVMVFGSQTFDAIRTREGKEAMRQEVLSEVQKLMTEQTGKPCVEDVYFTSFVVQ